MAVEHPHAGIIRHEADDEVPLRRQHEGISSHGVLGEGSVVGGVVGHGVTVLVGVEGWPVGGGAV